MEFYPDAGSSKCERSVMANNTTAKPWHSSSEVNSLSYTLQRMLACYSHAELVMVNAVSDGLCTVTPMVIGSNADGTIITQEKIYGIPYFRLQMGSSAVIIDPSEGDIGLMIICDDDITNVKANKKASVASHGLKNGRSNGIYLGGIQLLNGNPSEYIKFTGSGIEIAGDINQTSGNFTTSGTVTATGEVTGNGIALSSHVHGGVESGGSNTGGPQ